MEKDCLKKGNEELRLQLPNVTDTAIEVMFTDEVPVAMYVTA